MIAPPSSSRAVTKQPPDPEHLAHPTDCPQQLQNNLQTLASSFPDPNEKLFRLLRGEPFAATSKAVVDADDSDILDSKELIKEERGSLFRNVDASDIDLFNTNEQ